MCSLGSDTKSLSSVSFFLIGERASLREIHSLFCWDQIFVNSWQQTSTLTPVVIYEGPKQHSNSQVRGPMSYNLENNILSVQ